MNATRTLAISASILVLLSGCVAAPRLTPATEQTPDGAIYEALGTADVGDLRTSMSELGTELTGDLDDLWREVRDQIAPYDLPTGGGFAVSPVRTIVPGLDVPVEGLREYQERTRSTPNGPVHETGRVQQVIADQQLRYAMEHSARLESDTLHGTDNRASGVDVMVCSADDEGRVNAEWSMERRVVTVDEAGTRTTLEVTAVGTISSGSSTGAMSVDTYILDATRTTTTASGITTIDRGNLSARFSEWGADGMPTEAEHATVHDIESTHTSDWFDEQVGNLIVGTLAASTVEIKAMIAAALEARNDLGLCVSVEYDAGGVTTLGPGEQVTITAWVVDTRTGERIQDAPITASTLAGRVTPDSSTGETMFTFTAPSEAPPYFVDLATYSERGGDHVQVVFAGGWKFEGVTMSITVGGYTSQQVWSGVVCGDPFEDAWRFTQNVAGDDITYDLVVPPLGTRLTGDYGQQPMIEEIHQPGRGEPPFRLYIDDIEPPEVTPQTQRIEVAVLPAGDECAE